MRNRPLFLRRATSVALLVFAGAIGACGGGAATANAPGPVTAVSSADDEASNSLREHHRYHHHGGATLFIAMSLDTLGVTADQRLTVEKIRRDLHAALEPARAAEQALVTTLADELAASKFDQAKTDAAVAQVSASASAAHDASADALNQLHATLTPAQRGALVDKLEAHWAVWQRSNAEDATTPPQHESNRLTRLASEIDLTPAQVTQIRARLDAGAKAKPPLDVASVTAHLRAFGEAFRGEKFDAKSVTTGGAADARIATSGASSMAHFIEAVSPDLTNAQRESLAARLREHATYKLNAEVSQ
jgi:Spy/CpxP family protein refolding chaperone